MPKGYDIVVAGGGHQGHIAAGYLAKAGLNVCVVEGLIFGRTSENTVEIKEGIEFLDLLSLPSW